MQSPNPISSYFSPTGYESEDDPDYEGEEYIASTDYGLQFYPKINPMGPGRSYRGDLSSESASSLSSSTFSPYSSSSSNSSNSRRFNTPTSPSLSSVSSRRISPRLSSSQQSRSPLSSSVSTSKSISPNLPKSPIIQPMSQSIKQSIVVSPTLQQKISSNPINVQQQLNDKQLNRLGEKECLEAGRIYRKQTEKRKSSCAKKPIPKGSLKESCKKAGGIYKKSIRKICSPH